jgi:hypothetical protein
VNEKELIRSAAEKAQRIALKPLGRPASDKGDTKPRNSKPHQFTYNPCLTSECTGRPEWISVTHNDIAPIFDLKYRHELHPLTVIAHKLPMKKPALDFGHA